MAAQHVTREHDGSFTTVHRAWFRSTQHRAQHDRKRCAGHRASLQCSGKDDRTLIRTAQKGTVPGRGPPPPPNSPDHRRRDISDIQIGSGAALAPRRNAPRIHAGCGLSPPGHQGSSDPRGTERMRRTAVRRAENARPHRILRPATRLRAISLGPFGCVPPFLSSSARALAARDCSRAQKLNGCLYPVSGLKRRQGRVAPWSRAYETGDLPTRAHGRSGLAD